MPIKSDCECRFSTVEVMGEAEKKKYSDKTRCNNCGKIKYTKRAVTGSTTEAEALRMKQEAEEERAAAEADETAAEAETVAA